MSDATQHITIKGRLSKSEFERLYKLSSSQRKKLLNVELFDKISVLGYEKESWYITIPVMKKIVELIGPPEMRIEL